MQKKEIQLFLTSKLDLIWQKLDAKEIDILSANLFNFYRKNKIKEETVINVDNYLSFAIESLKNNICARKNIEETLNKLKNEYFETENKEIQNKLILKYSKGIVKKSFLDISLTKKLLKTLDFDGLSECYTKNIHQYTRNNTTIYRLLSGILSKNKNTPCLNSELLDSYIKIISQELKNINPDITKNEILSSLILLIKNNSKYFKSNEDLLKNIYDLETKNNNTWIKCNCIELFSLLQNEKFHTVINKYLSHKTCSDIFIREYCVNFIIKNNKLFTSKAFSNLLELSHGDPNPFVRQALALNLDLLSIDLFNIYYKKILLSDSEVSVRCSALKNAEIAFSITENRNIILTTIEKALNNDVDDNFLKYALNTTVSLLLISRKQNSDLNWADNFISLAHKLYCNKDSNIPIRRFAANIKEKLWCFSTDKAYTLYEKIVFKINKKRKCKAIKFNANEFKDCSDEIVGRVLSVIAQNDFSLDLTKGVNSHKLTIGPTFCFRWWRFFHELRNPSPEKRQTVKHTTGRLFKGTIRASSGIMSEQSETKVPGEPLFIDQEGNSRPYLPLVDELISAAEFGKKVDMYSSEGITTIEPPKSFFKRYISEVKLTFSYGRLAKLRNWQAGISQSPPSSYIELIRKLGFTVKLKPFEDTNNKSIDPEVSKFFFPAILPVGLVQFSNNLKIYFLSLYENTVYQLSVFILLFILFITGRHYFLNLLIKKARNSIPLVIGGWGTRGKSGTERIKAALFSALGCTVVSKTTGCEAMFLYTPNFGKTHELFLFRPYDKATIWEQFNLIKTASKLNADVFLWECMALSPPYVKVLQHDWMRDDYSTITNTYPDHEDLQGPAGWNIAETMTNFIPKKSVLFTSEEQMHPILEVGARKNKTDFFTINKLDTMLITPDILERFPYEEHPYNIELVLKMSEFLGISRQFTLKEMADNVVPDIGVLKRYEPGVINNRNIEFYSGMSANERFGCMGNWTRMKFDQYNLEDNPDIFIATVVNNRADRIARSKVFAQILVEDLNADKHFLIGNNLEGFMGYIREAWNNKMDNFTLAPVTNKENNLNPFDIFNSFATKLRIPTNEKHIKSLYSTLFNNDKINSEKENNWNNIDLLSKSIKETKNSIDSEALNFYKKYLKNFKKYNEIAERLKKSYTKNFDEECKKFFWNIFKAKFCTVNNYYASGNEVLKVISDSTPPNFKVKLMALQNIKGTGLDFFYRWQAWEDFSKLCNNALSSKELASEEALASISAYKEYDILWIDRLKKVVKIVRESNTSNQNINTLIEKIETTLNNTSYENFKASKNDDKNKVVSYIVNSLENFLDPGDAIKRRKKTDKVYKDLIAGRISCANAIKELHILTKRQKGGWLKSKK